MVSVGKPFVVEEFEQPADALIDGLDAAQVIVHVALVFPAHEVFALELGGAEGGVARLVIGVPGPALLGRQVFRGCQLEVDRGHRLGDRHILVVLRLAAPRDNRRTASAARDSDDRGRGPGGGLPAAIRGEAPCAGT